MIMVDGFTVLKKGEAEFTLTGWSCSTPGPIILTSCFESPSSTESVAIVTSEGSNGSDRSAVNKSTGVGNTSIHLWW